MTAGGCDGDVVDVVRGSVDMTVGGRDADVLDVVRRSADMTEGDCGWLRWGRAGRGARQRGRKPGPPTEPAGHTLLRDKTTVEAIMAARARPIHSHWDPCAWNFSPRTL